MEDEKHTGYPQTETQNKAFLKWYWLGCNPIYPDSRKVALPYRVRELGLLSPGDYLWIEHLDGAELYDFNEETVLFLSLLVITKEDIFFRQIDDWFIWDYTEANTPHVTSSNLLILPMDMVFAADRDIGISYDVGEDDTTIIMGPNRFCPGMNIHFLTSPGAWKHEERIYLVEDATMRHLSSLAASYAEADSAMEELSDPESLEAITPPRSFFDLRYLTPVPLEDIESWEDEMHPQMTIS